MLSWFGLVLDEVLPGLWIQHVVLNEEDDIEEDGHDGEHELNDVERVLAEEGLSSRHGVDDLLKEREHTTSQVANDVLNGPSHGALSLEVQVHLHITVLDHV